MAKYVWQITSKHKDDDNLGRKNLSVVHLSNITNRNQAKCTCSAEKTPVVI